MWTYNKLSSLIVILGIALYMLCYLAGSRVPGAATQPDVLMLSNDQFRPESSDPAFTCAMDSKTTYTSDPTLRLSSETAAINSNGNAACNFRQIVFLGKRVRVTAMIKSEDLANWGGMALAAIGSDSKWLRFDTTSNQLVGSTATRPIRGTTDWTKVEIVSDIPKDTAMIWVGLQLKGQGKLWMDRATVEVVGADVPTTDDQNPHLYSDYSPKYSLAMDETMGRDGHPVVCVTPHAPPRGAHCWFGSDDRQPDQYLGHRVRLSAWMKCQGNASAHLSLVAAIPRKADREIDNQAGQPAFPLSHSWRRYEVTGNVPANAQNLVQGDFLWSGGKVWIDDMKVEIID